MAMNAPPSYEQPAGEPDDSHYRIAPLSSAPPPLPPMQHSFDAPQQAMQPHFAAVPLNGGPPPPQPLGAPYNVPQYPSYPNGAMQAAAMKANGMMRFPLPPQPVTPNALAGGRHKKDIKRRTKTGCLTCRKRRIKCDEEHPTCRNCLKSKRECLGYDPIFKQQSGHAPLQPAPSVPSPKAAAAAAAPGAFEAFPGTGGTFVPAANGAVPRIAGNFNAYGAGAPLDPALSAGEQPLNMQANGLEPTRIVKPIDMEQLFAVDDQPPRYEIRDPPPPPTVAQKEIDDFYEYHFANGLDRLFETTWYSALGRGNLQSSPLLLDFVTQCMEQFKTQDSDESLQPLEARLVWHLACMPREAWPANVNASRLRSPEHDPRTAELLPRVATVEALLTGQHLAAHLVPQFPSTPALSGPKYNEHLFWHHLGTLVSLRDDTPDPVVAANVDETLGQLRAILSMMENRDVLYSIAVARSIGGRLPGFDPNVALVPAPAMDPVDPVGRAEVARQFVKVEDQKGTTQVVQRICGMALRSWALQKR